MITRSPQVLLQRTRGSLFDSPRIALRRPGARNRWSLVIVAVLLLCSAPAVVHALPVSTPERTVPQLLDLVRASDSVPFTGYAESRGTLNLPDVNTLGQQVAELLSDKSRLRIWHEAADSFRVDRIKSGGEDDSYVAGMTTLTWSSNERRVTRTVAAPLVPVPTPPNVLPTTLGRQLLSVIPADGSGVRRIGSARIAGRGAAGLTWRPNDPRSLVGEVRLWVDPHNGLPLRVQMLPTSSRVVAFETSFLDLQLARPDPAALRFDVSSTERIDVQDTPPPAPQDLMAVVRLPMDLAGLPRRSDAKPLVATYGDGAALVAVTAFDSGTADSLRQQIDSPGRPPVQGSFGEGTVIEAPMLQALIFSSGDRGYALAGTVTQQVLQQIALQLATNPPEKTMP